MSSLEKFIIPTDVQDLAATYEAAQRVVGVPAESLALAVNRYGDHISRGDAPRPEDVRGVTATIINTVMSGVADPVLTTINATAHKVERMPE